MAEPTTGGGFLDPSLLEDKPPEQLRTPRREFFADRLVWYAALSIFTLAGVDTVVQFVRGATLACNLHNVEASAAADVTYITNYCYGELPQIQWITVFNVITGMLVLAPHYLWLNIAYGKSIEFFTLANQLDTVPSPKTGMWHMQNILLVKRIERLVYNSKSVLIGYIVKVVIQLLFAMATLLVAVLAFSDGNVNFYCPQQLDNSTFPKFWPLSYQVECTSGNLQSLVYLRWVDIVLLIVIIVGLFAALMTHTVLPNPAVVHSHGVAEFTFRSSLDPKSYAEPRWRCGLQMNSDMHFHLAELMRASEDLASTFQTVQAYLREVDEINANEMARVSFLRKYARDQSQSLQDVELWFPQTSTRYLTITSPNILKVPTLHDEKYMARPRDPYTRTMDGSLLLEQDVRGAVLSFAVYCCKRDGKSRDTEGVAVVVKYGKMSLGIPCALARAFKKVILVNFNYHYKNPRAAITKWEYPTVGYTAVTFHPHVLWEKCDEVVETIRHIWGQAPAPPQFELTRTVEQTWEKALPRRHLVQHEEEGEERVAGHSGRETTSIKKVWKEQPRDETPDPAPPSPTYPGFIQESKKFTKHAPAFHKITKHIPASQKSDLIVLSPIKNELDKTATTLFLTMLHSEGYLSEEARLLSTYPLTVAGKDVTKEFWEYPERSCMPPDVQQDKRMGFQIHRCLHKETNTSGDGLPASAGTTDGERRPLVGVANGEDEPLEDDSDDEDQPPCTHDLTLKCGSIDCEFRFSLYKKVLPAAVSPSPE